MAKAKTISLSQGWAMEGKPLGAALGYRVERVTNSVEFDPGRIISKSEADELCSAKDWTVTITAPPR